MKKIIYLDHHASTPLAEGVLDVMLPFLKENYANASASYLPAQVAKKAVEKARQQVASVIGAQSHEIIFTAGATESNNLAIKGCAQAYKKRGNHIISVVTEHKSVLDPLKRLSMNGYEVTLLPVKKNGLVDLKVLEKAMTSKTILISVMFANNEIGVIQSIKNIGKMAKAKDILFHCDAAQAYGKIPIDVHSMNIDFLSASAHKIYGPKGVGLLYLRKGSVPVRVVPQTDGGAQEGGYRSGTLNVSGIVGFGKASEIAMKRMKRDEAKIRVLRDKLLLGLRKINPAIAINGDMSSRLYHNLNVLIPGFLFKEFQRKFPNICVSSGSACLSTSPETSYVLKAMNVPENLRLSAIRFGLGRQTTAGDIRTVLKRIDSFVNS